MEVNVVFIECATSHFGNFIDSFMIYIVKTIDR